MPVDDMLEETDLYNETKETKNQFYNLYGQLKQTKNSFSHEHLAQKLSETDFEKEVTVCSV